jgi:hypothetical protein
LIFIDCAELPERASPLQPNLRHSLSNRLVSKAKVESKTVQGILRHACLDMEDQLLGC